MRKLCRVRWLGAVLASFGLAACAEETALPSAPSETRAPAPTTAASPTTTTATPETLPPAGPADEDVEVLVANVTAINQAQRARTAATDRFRVAEGRLLTIVEAYEELYASDLSALDELLTALLDGELGDRPLAAARDDFVDATRTLRDETQRIADDIAERRDELEATSGFRSDNESPSPELEALAQAQVDEVERWQTACFELQAALVGIVDEPIDCAGVDRTPDVTSGDDVPDGSGTPDGDDLAEVTVSTTCVRNNGLDTLPFDPSPYAFIANARPEQGWILDSFTIDNPTDEWVRVVDYRYQLFADDGSLLATTDGLGLYGPNNTAAPGQTAHRNGFLLEDVTRGLRGEELGDDLIDKIFRQTADCGIVDTQIITIDPTELVDEDMAGNVEVIGCGPDEASGRWLVDYRVTNPFDRPIRIGISTQLLSAGGDRLGMAGIGDSDGLIGPSEEVLLQGWSVFYTIEDVTAVDRCDVFTVDLVVE